MDGVTTLPRRPPVVGDLEAMPDDGHRDERAGLAAYWVVNPRELWLRAWELGEGRYAEVAHVVPGQVWRSEAPYAVTLDPGTLADRPSSG